MPDVFEETLRVYRARQARGVGGPYGMAAKPLLGWDPCPSLIFFNDWTIIKRSSPSSNFYSTSGPTKQKIEDKVTRSGGVIQTQDQVQLIMKAERTFDDVQCLIVPFALARHVSAWQDENTLGIGEVAVKAALLKVPLADGGQFDLQNVTWNDANRRPNWDQSTPLSPLFATAANFENIPQRILFAQGDPLPLGPDVIDNITVGWGGGVTDPSGVPTAGIFIKGVSGPYTGIFLNMDSGFQGGQQSAIADSAFEEAEIEEIRPAHFIQNDQRPFLVQSNFSVVFNIV